jgi:hypothetical protein
MAEVALSVDCRLLTKMKTALKIGEIQLSSWMVDQASCKRMREISDRGLLAGLRCLDHPWNQEVG